MIDWFFYRQYHFANACSQGIDKFVIHDGDGISELCGIIVYSGNVLSVYLLTGRNYVCKSAVILEFPYLLLTAWVHYVSKSAVI